MSSSRSQTDHRQATGPSSSIPRPVTPTVRGNPNSQSEATSPSAPPAVSFASSMAHDNGCRASLPPMTSNLIPACTAKFVIENALAAAAFRTTTYLTAGKLHEPIISYKEALHAVRTAFLQVLEQQANVPPEEDETAAALREFCIDSPIVNDLVKISLEPPSPPPREPSVNHDITSGSNPSTTPTGVPGLTGVSHYLFDDMSSAAAVPPNRKAAVRAPISAATNAAPTTAAPSPGDPPSTVVSDPNPRPNPVSRPISTNTPPVCVPGLTANRGPLFGMGPPINGPVVGPFEFDAPPSSADPTRSRFSLGTPSPPIRHIAPPPRSSRPLESRNDHVQGSPAPDSPSRSINGMPNRGPRRRGLRRALSSDIVSFHAEGISVEVDRQCVQPSGFLAHVNGIRLMIDELDFGEK